MFLFITDNYTQDVFDYLRISLSQKHLSQISLGCTASEWCLEYKKKVFSDLLCHSNHKDK